jgi:2-dehydropantoate 2-reductase
VLVATKAHDAFEAVRSLRSRLGEGTRVILLCNGALSVLDRFRAQEADWGREAPGDGGRGTVGPARIRTKCPARIFPAWTSHGAYQPAPTTAAATGAALDEEGGDDEYEGIERLRRVVHAGTDGRTAVQGCEDVAAAWDAAGLRCSSVPPLQMQRELWLKLAANCAVNPLTALRNCANGELLRGSGARCVVDSVVREVVRVANASEDVSGAELSRQEAIRFVLQVLEDTARNRSSMAQDLAGGRRTEIDDLNGFVVRRGGELGIACDENERLCRLVRQAEGRPDLIARNS